MKVVSIQLEMAGKPKAENVKHALSAIDRVPAADLILLPEIWTCGFFAFKRYADESDPLNGVVTHEKYNTLSHRSIGHYTHEKNALCAAAALAEIEVIETRKLAEHAADLGAYTLQRLNEMTQRHPLIGRSAGNP